MRKDYFIILFAIVIGFVSQILFKKVSLFITCEEFYLKDLTKILTIIFCNPIFYIAMLCYSIQSVLWLIGIKDIPISIAFSFTSLNFILIGIYSVFFLNEEFSILKSIACVLVILGIILLTRTNKIK